MKKIIPFVLIIFILSVMPANAQETEGKRLWQDETVYSIMVDRFNNADIKNDYDVNTNDPNQYNGGDFQGITDKLDYLKDMGFTAIRLSPIFANAKGGYHGFWVTDFYKVDKHFGTMKEFQTLVKEAHKRKMKVIVDFVANNTAKTHPWVNDPEKRDWYHEQEENVDWTNQEQAEKGWVDGLPDLNQDNPVVSRYLIDAAKWWVKKTDIDGYSLPDIDRIPTDFWKQFADEVKGEKDNFYLLGIPAKDTDVNLKQYQNAGIDSLFDYSQSEKMRYAFANTSRSFKSITQQQQPITATFFDNEYTARFTRDIVEERQFPGSRWKTALTYLYTTPGVPIVYYGTEIALTGGEIPDNRRIMSFRAEKDLIDYITQIGEVREQQPSLTRGTITMLYDKNGMVVYKREYKGDTTVIAINNTRKSQNVTLTSDQLEGDKELRALLSDNVVRSQNGQYTLIIDRDNSEIFYLADKTGLNMPYITVTIVAILLILVFLFLIIKRGKQNRV
ncbi:alpha-amylase family glycosyl hydrolase [Neobacillus dielmonensis]|uniref:alpha-amylase family glycosyl hydrolase n=1 Tax=Neobacillus dielmonensis TaxID=1347369 RepID=UPI0005A6FAC7|nr:alpha-amylase family glycosyl hydrolase [Neobacillus dielmonensis]